jgi:YbgC/YbaW family acyl-CoA thioester hydrolase
MADEFAVHVFPSDCDGNGHVNHAAMLTLLERARWAALERKATYREYMGSGPWAVVRHVDASYHAQSYPGDDFTIRTGLTRVGNTSFVVRQSVKNQNGVHVCDVSITYVTIDGTGRPVPVPQQWREMFSPWDDQPADHSRSGAR